MLLRELERLGKQKRKNNTHPPVVAISRLLSHDGGMAELGGEREMVELNGGREMAELGGEREMAELSGRFAKISGRKGHNIEISWHYGVRNQHTHMWLQMVRKFQTLLTKTKSTKTLINV